MTEKKESRIGSNCHVDSAKPWPAQVSIIYQRVMRWAQMITSLFPDLAQLLHVGCPGKGARGSWGRLWRSWQLETLCQLHSLQLDSKSFLDEGSRWNSFLSILKIQEVDDLYTLQWARWSNFFIHKMGYCECCIHKGRRKKNLWLVLGPIREVIGLDYWNHLAASIIKCKNGPRCKA